MTIKQPAIYDISHWKEVTDFNAIDPRPLGIITKATEGVSFVDSKFVRFMQGMKDAGYVRGCYHWFNVRYDGAGQARHFINIIRSYVDDKTILALDYEEAVPDAIQRTQPAQVWSWFETVRATFQKNIILLYTRRNIIERLIMTNGEKEYFKKIPVWIAGYPTYPDLFDEVPNAYIPDPTRFGPVVLWQYDEEGMVNGIQGEVDLNWIAPSFAAQLGTTETPQEPTTEEPMPNYFKVTAGQLNLRAAGAATAADIGDVYANDVLQCGELVNGWRQVQAIWRNNAPVALPAPVVWAHGAYMVATTFVPPAPAGLPDVLWIGETRETVREYRKAV